MRLTILYLACHEILEHDDLRMFTGSGHRVFSLGEYADPARREYQFREPLPAFHDAELWAAFQAMGGNLHAKHVPAAFAALFDVVIVNHHAQWVRDNQDAFAARPVILRTIGQSTPELEQEYRALGERVTIVRYAASEVNLPGFAKTDAVIYFGKYPDDFAAWQGDGPGITLHNGYAQRAAHSFPTLQDWRALSRASPTRLFGAWNEGLEESAGILPDRGLPETYRGAAHYAYVYTRPPSYTLSFIEAFMAGVPVLAPSAAYVAAHSSAPCHDGWTAARYEVPALLAGACGVTYDSIEEAIAAARLLAADPSAARAISRRGRAAAISHFDAGMIARQWDQLFRALICTSTAPLAPDHAPARLG